MNIGKIIEIAHDNGIDVIDYKWGRLKYNGRVYDTIAVMCAPLTENQFNTISALKNVIKIGVCHYRYAPEIEYNVIYVKE